MGLLSLGTPLEWNDAKKHADHIREHGIIQLMHVYDMHKDRKGDQLLFGDELEYMVVNFGVVQPVLSLRASDVLLELQKEQYVLGNKLDSTWHPEYGRYMLEGTPSRPFGSDIKDLLQVEQSMVNRRKTAEKFLEGGEELMTLTNFPLLGAAPCLEPAKNVASQSILVSDGYIAPHLRFPTLTANIRTRRGSKVSINVPVFHDQNTTQPYVENYLKDVPAALPDNIYMDCMLFGMGCSCLQVTFQSSSLDEARWMYDQMAVLTPIMLAVTASSPIFRGTLADVDCRWNIISASVDDRTEQERGVKESSGYRIYKSRYDSISAYISDKCPEECNNLPCAENNVVKQRLLQHGFDATLAKHFAHLFIRDPLVIFKELLNVEDSASTDHFENIQSTNWQTMRFKPPPPFSQIGWRIEFRSMEIHLTEFENAAFTCFVNLVYRTILHFQLDLYIPLSKVDLNMANAQKRDSVNSQVFYFRKDTQSSTSEICMMTTDQIINGNTDFTGLVPLIHQYLDSQTLNVQERQKLNSYIELVSKRSSGELLTTASWIRRFVQNHPQYKKDSKVEGQVSTDLLVALRDITKGKLKII